MAKKYNYVFYLAILIAFAATFGVYRIMEATRRANQVVTRPVVVANKDIPHGLLLEDDAFRVEHWPEPIVPDSAFGDPTLLAGRVAGMPIFAGEVFVQGRANPDARRHARGDACRGRAPHHGPEPGPDRAHASRLHRQRHREDEGLHRGGSRSFAARRHYAAAAHESGATTESAGC